jgi:hypothetical protein
MKKGIAVIAAMLVLAGIGLEAEACSASGVVGLARQAFDNNRDIYDAARDAVGTVFEDRWTKEDSYVAGVGALIEESWSYSKGGWPGDGYAELADKDEAIRFLTSDVITTCWKNHYLLGSSHRVYHDRDGKPDRSRRLGKLRPLTMRVPDARNKGTTAPGRPFLHHIVKGVRSMMSRTFRLHQRNTAAIRCRPLERYAANTDSSTSTSAKWCRRVWIYSVLP